MSSSAERFLQAAQSKKVLGAYLIVCSRGDVAARVADLFLTKLYCAKGGCGVCPDCLKVAQGHVDIMRLCAPKVAELREALGFVAEKPYDADFKSVVIAHADDMTPAAANSLLKTLEEPPQNTVFLLLARSASGVLPTISSRCSLVLISPEPHGREAIARALGVDAAAAAILADLSGGYLDEARRIKDDTELFSRRSDVLSLTHKLLYSRNMAISTFCDFLENSRETIVPLLGVMQSYLRDILVFQKTQNDCLIINQDRLNDIYDAAADFTSGALSNMIKIILETERRFSAAVNFRLAVERMLFCLLEEKNRWKKS